MAVERQDQGYSSNVWHESNRKTLAPTIANGPINCNGQQYGRDSISDPIEAEETNLRQNSAGTIRMDTSKERVEKPFDAYHPVQWMLNQSIKDLWRNESGDEEETERIFKEIHQNVLDFQHDFVTSEGNDGKKYCQDYVFHS